MARQNSFVTSEVQLSKFLPLGPFPVQRDGVSCPYGVLIKYPRRRLGGEDRMLIF